MAHALRIQHTIYDVDGTYPFVGPTRRYRLKLRDSDDAFFRSNMLDAFLPTPFRLEGVAAQQGAGAGAAGEQGADTAAAGEDGASAVQPIRNASWWRLYDNASFMAQHLDDLVEREGLSLQVGV